MIFTKILKCTDNTLQKEYMALILMFSSCSIKSEFQKVINAITKQSKFIENFLEQLDINFNSDTVVNISNNDIVDGMDEAWEAYDLTNKDGSKYLLIQQF